MVLEATGNWEVVGDPDWFRVELVAGQSYRIEIVGPDGEVVRVLDPNGVAIDFLNGSATSTNGFSDNVGHFTPRTSGTYYFSANGEAVGQYTIRITEVADDFDDNVDSTGVFTGGVANGRLEEPSDADYFNVDLAAFTQYDYSLNAPAGATVMIVNAAGVPVHFGEQGGTFVPVAAGRYSFVVLAPEDTQAFVAGNYSLTLSATPTTDDFSNNVNTTGIIDLFPDANGFAAGSLDATWNYVTDSDWFRVELVANNTYVIGADGFLDDESGFLTIVDANGNFVQNFGSTFVAEGGNNSFAFTPGATGTYFIQANASGAPGAYRVSVQQIADDFTDSPARPGQLTVNGPDSSGLMQANADVDYFAVNLTQGQSYSVFNGLGGFNGTYFGTAFVVGPDGTRHDTQFSATTTGTYYVAIEGFAFRPEPPTTQYAVGIDSYVDDFTDNAQRAGSLQVGGSATGNIEVSNDTDWFAVTLTANVRYVFSSDSPGALTLHSTNGTLTGDVRSFTPTQSGTYYLSHSDSVLGSYQVSVQAVPDDYLDNVGTTGRFTGGSGGGGGGAVDFDTVSQGSSDFGAGPAGGGWTSQNDYPRLVADINGDGRGDIVGFGDAGTFVALGQANGSFAPMALVDNEFGRGDAAGGWSNNDRYTRLLGDVNGDGRADIVGFGENATLVALGDGNGGFGNTFVGINAFGAGPAAGSWESQNLFARNLADVNGDGRDDIVGFGTNGTFVSLANADGTFGNIFQASSDFGRGDAAGGWTSNDQYPRMLADVNGDGRADVVGFGSRATFVGYGNADGTFDPMSVLLEGQFGNDPSAGGWESQERFPRQLADVNGDNLADIIGFGSAGVYYSLNNGASGFGAFTLAIEAFGTADSAGGWSGNNQFPRIVADVNGDGRDDILGFGSSGVFVALAEGAPSLAAEAPASTMLAQESDIADLLALAGDNPVDGGEGILAAFVPARAGTDTLLTFPEADGDLFFALPGGLEDLSNHTMIV